jgi:nucleoside-diphosphate-sugar epimerase
MALCLVTGGAGFIGSHIVRHLLARGDHVRVLDNFSTGKRENLTRIQGSLEVIEGDLRNSDEVFNAVRGVDLVFHQAAEVSVPRSMEDPQTCFDVNVNGTNNLLEAARKSGVRRVVIASSCAVYGNSQNLPLVESETPQLLSPYSASKYVTEIYADLYSRIYGLDVVALRYFNVYGPRQSPQSDYAAVIPIFIHRLLNQQAPTVYGDGFQKRDFIFVEDIVRANFLAAEAGDAAGKVYNVCTGHDYSLQDLLDVLSELIPNSVEANYASARPGDIYRSIGNPGKAAKELGFEAQENFIDGLARTLEWMRV